jgi:hypothetical protein
MPITYHKKKVGTGENRRNYYYKRLANGNSKRIRKEVYERNQVGGDAINKVKHIYEEYESLKKLLLPTTIDQVLNDYIIFSSSLPDSQIKLYIENNRSLDHLTITEQKQFTNIINTYMLELDDEHESSDRYNSLYNFLNNMLGLDDEHESSDIYKLSRYYTVSSLKNLKNLKNTYRYIESRRKQPMKVGHIDGNNYSESNSIINQIHSIEKRLSQNESILTSYSLNKLGKILINKSKELENHTNKNLQNKNDKDVINSYYSLMFKNNSNKNDFKSLCTKFSKLGIPILKKEYISILQKRNKTNLNKKKIKNLQNKIIPENKKEERDKIKKKLIKFYKLFGILFNPNKVNRKLLKYNLSGKYNDLTKLVNRAITDATAVETAKNAKKIKKLLELTNINNNINNNNNISRYNIISKYSKLYHILNKKNHRNVNENKLKNFLEKYINDYEKNLFPTNNNS